MLKTLSISNYALIDELQMQPSPALSMITGETGAGKSIMLGAVGLLLGNRADTKVLLTEEKKCIIEGVFEIGAYGLGDFFETQELDYETPCIIRREISPSGKSRSFVNDTPVKLDVLKELGAKLMDVHSQHDTLQLADGKYQLGIIDAFAQSQAEIKVYKTDYSDFRKAKKAFDTIQREAIELQKEADFNQFQLDELSSLTLQTGEQEEMESNQEILENAEEIKQKINELLNLFHDEQFGLVQGLSQVQQGLQNLGRLAHKFDGLKDRFQETFIELKDIADTLGDEEGKVEIDFEKLDEIRERLSKIYQLQKKHGVNSVEELMAIEAELAEKVFQVQNLDENLKEAEEKLKAAEKKMLSSGELLSKKRKSCFSVFEKSLQELLSGLGMENAKIQVECKSVAPSNSGLDEVEILFSANKGSMPQPLKKVASGGEFSRLLFGIKYLMADKMALPTLIFDEIDTGISGEVALQMVRMMKEISKEHQVICITHLPQVAAKGDMHYFVYKDNNSDRTISKIKLLDETERVSELAKMIAGSNPSSSAVESAKELLHQ
ncbi:DNA repair protein RecN [Algoriphagus zhangzhouensis]|uniref:DNA repair protein RecN n=1 Tax=Algoriphagus zhangzhouensis TaxID=1073327 RepID=A0A1M7ZGS4_9BACT|nr:DNA repair protein RecN [Algoriphagus zhangzhouensis]TDY44666.1 DNA replication and repair protein RecN [Algoriphagus zhangzhouensis]SHO64042.1 DNA repair protein RecN (Recombination protein N) [Algoriphagus zhangzhouensis]